MSHDTMLRSRQIDALASLGFSFVPYYNKLEKNGKWRKSPAAKSGWMNKTFSAEEMKKKNPQMIAVRAGADSGNIIWLDLDFRFDEFLATFPQLQDTLLVTRPNEPARGKLAIHITDLLPKTTSWYIEGIKSPQAELISTGRTAIVLGTHYTGAPYQLTGTRPIAMTFADLNGIWQAWTGEALADPREPAPTHRYAPDATPRQHGQSGGWNGDNLKERVKDAWPALAVFQRYGKANDVSDEKPDEYRLGGNGGLCVGKPGTDKRDIWRNHGLDIGGNQFAAWAYCTGRTLDRHNFREILLEMAQAAGIEVAPPQNNIIPPEPSPSHCDAIPLDSPANLRVVCQREDREPRPFDFPTIEARANDPDLYPNRYTRRADRYAMLGVIQIMRRAGRSEGVRISSQALAEEIGIGRNSAGKALARLCDYGLLHRTLSAWLPAEEKALLSGYEYAISEQLCNMVHRDINHTDREVCTILHTLRNHMKDEYFMHGASADKGFSFGKAALDVLAELAAENDLSYQELAERAGMHRSTVSRKIDTLVHHGLAVVTLEGKRKIVHLIDDFWQRMLALWPRLKTFGRSLKRKASHLAARVGRYVEIIPRISSDYVRQKLGRCLERWRAQLAAVNRDRETLRQYRIEVLAA